MKRRLENVRRRRRRRRRRSAHARSDADRRGLQRVTRFAEVGVVLSTVTSRKHGILEILRAVSQRYRDTQRVRARVFYTLRLRSAGARERASATRRGAARGGAPPPRY